MTIINGAEPFFLPGDDRGILLIHGFTGSPSEMRLLGEHLNKEGYTVLAPRLCGHGTTVEEMSQTEWFHWYSSVEDGYHFLKGLCREISVAGLSMGGLLGMKLAIDYPIHRLVSLSTPIYINNSRLHLLPLYRMIRKYYPKKRRKIPDLDPKYAVAYDSVPLSSLNSLLELIKHVDNMLPILEVPILVMQSRVEHTVRPLSASHIYDKAGTKQKKIIWLERSGHIVTLDAERTKVFQEISQFLLEP